MTPEQILQLQKDNHILYKEKVALNKQIEELKKELNKMEKQLLQKPIRKGRKIFRK